MPLQAFSFPIPETRFIRAGNFIYKFKIRAGSSYSEEEVTEEYCFDQELEDIIRTVLSNLDCVQPFYSTRFNVFPYKKRWEGPSKVLCEHCDRTLKLYPFIVIIYLEKKMQNGKQAENLSKEKEVAKQIPPVCEPQSKRCKRDSPLEEALLKDLVKELKAESRVPVVSSSRLRKDQPHAGEEVLDHPGRVDEKGTKRFDEPQQKSGVNRVRGGGTPGGQHPGTNEDMGEEEEDKEDEEEGGNAAPETPDKPGVLTRLASYIFPFSLFFRDS